MSTHPAQRDGYLHQLADQPRAGDGYGRYDGFADEHLLGPFVLDRPRWSSIPVNCEVDPLIAERVRAFYQAVATATEKAAGVITGVLVDISHEGFGRVVVLAGRLVLLLDTLRDAQSFGFPSMETLAVAGQERVASALQILKTHPEVVRDDT
jgi:probable nitrogen fixation protein